MKTLNLNKIWEICCTLSEKRDELADKGTYIHLLGNRSNFTDCSFESFLDYYTFKIDGDTIEVFNNDNIPYENYTNEDYSYIPTVLLSFSGEKLNNWIETEIELQLAKQERSKKTEKEYIKLQIELLQKQLNN